MLMSYWPSSTRGRAIITTRSDSLAFDPASEGLEVTSWDAMTGSQFLLWLLKTNIGRDLNSESDSALALSERLGGHALVISQMAGLIQRFKFSIRDFMLMYLKNPRTAHERGEFRAIWELSFKSLNEDSRRLLGVMVFLMPDGIPHELFASPAGVDREYPPGLAFCFDDFQYVYYSGSGVRPTANSGSFNRLSEAIAALAALGLIKRDIDTGTLSVHRMVQTQFKYFMTPEQRLQCFNDAVCLVSDHFPTEDSKAGQMYDMWEACNRYAQHVVSLQDCFQEEQRLSKAFRASWQFCDLLCRSQR